MERGSVKKATTFIVAPQFSSPDSAAESFGHALTAGANYTAFRFLESNLAQEVRELSRRARAILGPLAEEARD